MTSRHPARIGRYEVIDRLGAGGMGAVYLASDPLLGRTVAIKILHSDDEELRQRFEREARSAASLRHQHIVTIYDIGEDDGRPFLAMEFLDGESMAEIVRRRSPLPIDARLELIGQLCSGLGYAHRNGIIHRDIKPANLMITSERVLKIVDFGLARVAASGSTMTRAGVLMGTPHYMSPEQVNGTGVDHLSDIFSVGVVLYELILYRKAYAGDSTPAILHNIVNGQPGPIEPWVGALDPELAQVVAKGLERAKERRYQDLRELAADVERIRGRLKANAAGTTVIAERGSPELGEMRTGGGLDDGTTRPDRQPSSSEPRTPGDARRSLDVIAQRRAAEIARHLAAASEHIDAGRLEPANEELEHALLLDPRDARALQLLSQVHDAMDDRQVSRWVEEARAEVSSGSLTKAEELVEQALRLRSEAADARRLQEQIRDTRRERERAADRARAVKAALDRARRNLQNGAFEAAARAATEALAYEQTHTEALALRQEALAAIEERRREQEREDAAQDLAAQGRALADAGDHDGALALLRQFDPPHPAVLEAIGEIEARVAALEQQRREEEERARQKAAEEARRQEQLAGLRQAAAAAFERSDWAAARQAVRAARNASRGDVELERLCRSIETETDAAEAAARLQASVLRHLQAGESAIVRGDLTAALKAADAAVSLMPKEAAALRLQQDVRERLARAEAERQRLKREREEQERLERERRDREEQERLEREHQEQERLEQERLERERKKQERLERERQERLERQRKEQERLERERVERERQEQERLEHERVERERQEQERLERERLEHERQEQERLEHERVEHERQEQQRLERERIKSERQEQERLERERVERELKARKEQERLERERIEQERKEQARLERERAEQERQEQERLERERLEHERKEQERLARERIEQERKEQARLERERLEHQRKEQERLERERVERERLELERRERERKEREKREREEQARAERERKERERAEQARLERERKEREKQERDERKRLERERKERAAREQEEGRQAEDVNEAPAQAPTLPAAALPLPPGAAAARRALPMKVIAAAGAAAVVVLIAVNFWPSSTPPPVGRGGPPPPPPVTDYGPVLQQALAEHRSGDLPAAIRTALSIPESAAQRPEAVTLLQQIRREATEQAALERRIAESAGKSREAAFGEAAARQQEAEKLPADADTERVVTLMTEATRLYRQAATTGLSPTELLQSARAELEAKRIPRAIDYALQALNLAPRDVGTLEFLRAIRAESERQTAAAADAARRAGANLQNSASFKDAVSLETQARGVTAPQEIQKAVDTLERARDRYVQSTSEQKQATLEKAQKIRDAANAVEQRLKANDADGATTALAELQRLNPNDAAIDGLRKRITDLRTRETTARRDAEIRKVLDSAAAMSSDTDAIKALQTALPQYGNDSRIQGAITARRQARDEKINDLLRSARAASPAESIDLFDRALALDASRNDIVKEREERRRELDGAAQERAIRELVARFASAFQSRNIDAVLALAPSLGRSELETQFKPYREIRVEIEPFTVAPGAQRNSATVTCNAILMRSPAGISSRPLRSSRGWRFTFTFANGAWRIESVQL